MLVPTRTCRPLIPLGSPFRARSIAMSFAWYGLWCVLGPITASRWVNIFPGTLPLLSYVAHPDPTLPSISAELVMMTMFPGDHSSAGQLAGSTCSSGLIHDTGVYTSDGSLNEISIIHQMSLQPDRKFSDCRNYRQRSRCVLSRQTSTRRCHESLVLCGNSFKK